MKISYCVLLIPLLIAQQSFAQSGEPPCVKIVEKTLTDLNYGSFAHPSSGVSKIRTAEGSYVFRAAGGPEVRFAAGKIDVKAQAFGLTTYTTITFDIECKISSVLVSSLGPSSQIFAKVDPDECKKIRSQPSAPNPSLTFSEQLSFALCNQYIPASLPQVGITPPAAPKGQIFK